MAIGINSMYKPAPKWFRIAKKIINITTTFVIALLMSFGHRSDDIVLLIIKLSQSFVMEILDTFMSNGEVYAQEDTTTVTATFSKVAAPSDEQLKNQ